MAGSPGFGGTPTPWWQLPNSGIDNIDKSTPAGYQFDRVKNQYVPIVGSPTDELSQRGRTQGMQNDLWSRMMGAFGGMNTFGGGTGGGGTGSGSGSPNSWTPSIWKPNTGDGGQFGNPSGGGQIDPTQLGPGSSRMGGGTAPGVKPIDTGSLGPGSSSMNFSAAAPTPIALPAAGTQGKMPMPARSTAAPWQSITGPNQQQQDAQESATFGKVKDNAANTAQAAMRGLTDSLTARGMSGGGYEGGQIGGTLSRTANQIGEGERQWAGQRYADAEHRADVNTNAGLTARGQDLSSSTAERGQDVGAGVATRGQDIGASTAARGQDLSAAESNLGAATTSRGQDLQALLAKMGFATAERGQNLGAEQSNQNAGVASRGQDVQSLLARMGFATAERGQNLGAAEANQSTGTARRGQDINRSTDWRGQDLTARGQDIQSQEANASLAQQKQLSLQAMLMNALRGMFGGGGNGGLY